MDFYDAITQAVAGKKITRTGWDSDKVYFYFKEETLFVHNEKSDNSVAICKADVIAKDWAVV